MSDVAALTARVVALEARLAAVEAGGARATSGGGGGDSHAVADDHDLNSEYGNPIVRYGLKPKYWSEQPDPFIGYKFSECTPEYLDATAKYLGACAYMKRKEGDDKKAGYKDRDAARARGWAAKIRAGYKAPVREQSDAADEELPF